MREIDRGLLLVFPRQPFVDWVNLVGPTGTPATLEEMRRDPDAILVPEFESAEDGDRLVNRLSREIFEHLLMEWHTNLDEWPATRDRRTFRQWFDVRCLPMVFDQVGQDIQFLP